MFQEHSGRVFRLQFDELQIVSSSHDNTILIWDFLEDPVGGPPAEATLGAPPGAAGGPLTPLSSSPLSS